MSHRISITVNDDTWGFLKEGPQGERSRTISQALREWVRRQQLDAVAEMGRLRSDAKAKSVTSAEIVGWILARISHHLTAADTDLPASAHPRFAIR